MWIHLHTVFMLKVSVTAVFSSAVTFTAVNFLLLITTLCNARLCLLANTHFCPRLYIRCSFFKLFSRQSKSWTLCLMMHQKLSLPCLQKYPPYEPQQFGHVEIPLVSSDMILHSFTERCLDKKDAFNV